MEGKITLDAMLYESNILGLHKVTGSGESLQIDYFDFVAEQSGEEDYDYVRMATCEDACLRWIVYDTFMAEI